MNMNDVAIASLSRDKRGGILPASTVAPVVADDAVPRAPVLVNTVGGSLSVADGVADVVAERVVIRDASTDLLRDDLATFLVANLQK